MLTFELHSSLPRPTSWGGEGSRNVKGLSGRGVTGSRGE